MHLPGNKIMVLFDGYCHLCSDTVQFILKYDRKKQFVFASLQGETAKQIREKFNVPENIDSVIIVDNEKASYYSDAFFSIVSGLGGIWKLFLFCKVFPRAWMDKLYRWIARNRFKWLGRQNSCFIPSEAYSDRFF